MESCRKAAKSGRRVDEQLEARRLREKIDVNALQDRIKKTPSMNVQSLSRKTRREGIARTSVGLPIAPLTLLTIEISSRKR